MARAISIIVAFHCCSCQIEHTFIYMSCYLIQSCSFYTAELPTVLKLRAFINFVYTMAVLLCKAALTIGRILQTTFSTQSYLCDTCDTYFSDDLYHEACNINTSYSVRCLFTRRPLPCYFLYTSAIDNHHMINLVFYRKCCKSANNETSW